MSHAAMHADAFYREAIRAGRVWTIRDAGGFPAPAGDGGRAMPFWSSAARVCKIISTVPAYAGFSPHEIELAVFQERWLPGLARDGLKVGLNWSGERAMGYDVEADVVTTGLATTVAADK